MKVSRQHTYVDRYYRPPRAASVLSVRKLMCRYDHSSAAFVNQHPGRNTWRVCQVGECIQVQSASSFFCDASSGSNHVSRLLQNGLLPLPGFFFRVRLAWRRKENIRGFYFEVEYFQLTIAFKNARSESPALAWPGASHARGGRTLPPPLWGSRPASVCKGLHLPQLLVGEDTLVFKSRKW